MNPLALLIAFLIGIFSDWGNAFFFVGGYLFGFVILPWVVRSWRS